MSARSTNIKINNNTEYYLLITEKLLSAGEWSGNSGNMVPPNGQEVYVGQNDSDGFLTGDEGSMMMAIIQVVNNVPQIKGAVSIGWDNPYAGSNSYKNSIINNDDLTVSNTNASGDNPTVYFTIGPKSTSAQ